MDRRRDTREQGFTVIEVLVALAVIVVGLLAVLTLLDNGNRTTARTMSREQATTLARDVVERARTVPYPSLAANAASLIAAQLPDSTTAVSGGSWTVRRRNVNYTVHVSACKIDDPSDGVGPVDASFCTTGTTNPGPGAGGGAGGSSASLTLLGLPVNVAVGGTVAAAVCTLLGQSATLDGLLGQANNLTALVGGGASVKACPSSSTQIALDTDPDDLTRVTTTVSWQSFGQTGTTTQSTLIPNPGVPAGS